MGEATKEISGNQHSFDLGFEWAIKIIARDAEDYRHDFPSWLSLNWHVFKGFEREALRVAARRSHYSAKTIYEVLRHHSLLAEKAGEWKLNNNFTGDLARLFEAMHPEARGFFGLRARKAKTLADENHALHSLRAA